MRKKMSLFLILVLFLALPFPSPAEESITITTYYPAPHGVYKSLRLYPGNEPACNEGFEGSMYYDKITHLPRICTHNGKEFVWQNLNSDKYWEPFEGDLQNITSNTSILQVGVNRSHFHPDHDDFSFLVEGDVMIDDSDTGALGDGNSTLHLSRWSNNHRNEIIFTGRNPNAGEKDFMIYTSGPMHDPTLTISDVDDTRKYLTLYYDDDDSAWEGMRMGIGEELATKALVVGEGSGTVFRCNWPGLGVAFNQGAGFWVKDTYHDVESMIEVGSYGGFGEEVRMGAISDHKLIIMTNHDAKMTILTDGRVGIGTRTPSALLEVAGDVQVNGSITATSCSSDKRFKKNVNPLEESLEKMSRLQGVSFEWDRETFKDKNFKSGKQIGLIAQDVEQVFPELVNTDAEGYKSLQYEKLTAVLVEAVKELKAQNQELMERVEKLEKGK